MWLFYSDNDQLPPTHVIATGFGWRSQNAAQEVINGLLDRGFVERNAVNKYRFSRDPGKELELAGLVADYAAFASTVSTGVPV